MGMRVGNMLKEQMAREALNGSAPDLVVIDEATDVIVDTPLAEDADDDFTDDLDDLE